MRHTPLTKPQPDLHLVRDPTFNSATGAVIFRLRVVLKW
jgi:hypothetical protein